MSEPQYVGETLAWCNKIRKRRGMAPLAVLPKGQRSDADSCPCGAATGAEVHGDDFRLPGGEFEDLPLPVQDFVVAFDEGRLPQYDADATA